jgi:hypothetical protein
MGVFDNKKVYLRRRSLRLKDLGIKVIFLMTIGFGIYTYMNRNIYT